MATSNLKRSQALSRIFRRYCGWLEKWHPLVLALSVALAAVGLFYSVKLYQNLRSDMEELLPETAQSVMDLKKLLGRVGGLNHISVVIESQDVEAGRRLQRDMAKELQLLSKDLVARVQFNIKEEQAFFDKNKSLYLDTQDWEDIARYVRQRIRFEKRAKNPFSLGLDDGAPRTEQPQYDFEALKKKYAQRSEGYTRFHDGLFESRDGRLHVVLAFLPGKITDIEGSKKLSESAHAIAERLNPKSYAPDMVVGFDGDVQNLVEEHHGLVEDLLTSFVLVTLLVGLVLIFYFRSFSGVYALCASVFAGTAWTFGLSYFLVGYLNANTAFLGSIVIGNGINFGIILLARYLEERRKGTSGKEALPLSIGFTAEATWIAAFAAGLSYVSLVLTDFRGFSQFGIIGGLGMALCWISSFTTLPAFLIWLENRGWIRPRVGEARPLIAGALAHGVIKAAKPLVALTAVSVVASLVLISRLSSDTLESDFSKLRNKESMLHGSGYWGTKVDSVFERYLTPTIILTSDPKDTPKIVTALQAIRSRDGDSTPIAELKTVDDFLPKDQNRKIRLIGEIRKELSPQVIKRLSSEDRKLVDELLPKEPPSPLSLEDLPTGVVYHFREMDGTLGRMVHVYPKLPGAPKTSEQAGEDRGGFWNGKEVIRFAEQLREAERQAAVPAAIAGQPPLSADMISAISTDGPKATMAAFCAVILLVIVLFPSIRLAPSILGALMLGVLWLGAIMSAFHLKINFLNFIALPITFGIGVDYAVNVFSRYRLDGSRSIARAIEQTGGAVALCSATTSIGYGSLLLAGSQAFVSFGVLAVVGELTCLLAAVVAFPAILHVLEEKEHETFDDVVPTAKG